MKPLVLTLAALVLVSAAATASSRVVDDLMMDLHIMPIEAETPPPLSVETLNGARVTLDDVKGHVVLVYFWATW